MSPSAPTQAGLPAASSSAAPTDARRFTVSELANRLGGELRGAGDQTVSGINSMSDARASEITFISDIAHARRWTESNAAAAIVSSGIAAEVTDGRSPTRPVIVVRDAEMASLTLLELFQIPEPLPEIGIHPSAVVHPSASIGRQVRIGPHVSIDREAVIGDGVTLFPGVRIYARAKIGQGSVLHANVVVRHACEIGRRVILNQLVSIGADGFGYRPSPTGHGLSKMPHLGIVIVEDDVEIGANSSIDRAKFGFTIIGTGTKIDNQVQIGHNVRVGRHCVIAGCTGISGSVKIGDGAQIGGGVGISDHVIVGAGARVGGMSFVTRDVPAGQITLGHPAAEAHAVLRQWASLRKLPGLLRRLPKHGIGTESPDEH